MLVIEHGKAIARARIVAKHKRGTITWSPGRILRHELPFGELLRLRLSGGVRPVSGSACPVGVDFHGGAATDVLEAIGKRRAGIEVEIDRLPDTQAARDLVEQYAVVPLYVRPIYRTEDDSDFAEEGGVATYSKATLRAVLIGATDEDSGFDEAIFTDPADVPARRRAARRLWL